MARPIDGLELLGDILAAAKRAGADAADAVWIRSTALGVRRRLGVQEKLERAEAYDFGLRVFIGKRQAIVSSTDFSAPTIAELVARAVAMARVAPEDPYCGIAGPGDIVRRALALEICDTTEPTAPGLNAQADRAEDAARAVAGVTNSEGAEAGWSKSVVAIAASNGLAQTYSVSNHSLSVSVLAGTGTEMERDYEFSTAVFVEDLASPEDIGRSAGERTVKRLEPRKVATTQVPIVFDPRVSGGFVRNLAAAINGQSIARGTSFLKDRLGKTVFRPGIRIVDDPLRPRGLRSKPFDAEGIATARRVYVEDGTLASWVLDLASARQLGLATTASAARGTASPPSPQPTNFYLEPGGLSPTALMADIRSGFYVTEMIGSGVNIVTGDYSRGATGFWIENGAIGYPVSEVTVAGSLKSMFADLTPANDLVFRYGVDAPTVRIDGMTVAGR